MTDIWRLTASDLAQQVRGREISAREAAQAALARLDAVNPMLNAVIEHRPDEVLAQADAVDAKIARGEEAGVLGGVPVTVKVNVDQAGYATTNGLRTQRDLVASSNSPVVDNFLRAGAVIVGRTNTPAFSLRWFTSNSLHGATKNPRDPSITPGGSSGGAASAVTAGIGHLAHGTDIGGSIRYPAYACGVHGLRPSLGRVPAFNASSPERGIGPQLMAVSGPIGRTIADLRLALTALSAPDPRDPWYTPAPLQGPAVRLRAALCVRPGGLLVMPEVEAALRDAADRLRAAGWTVDEVDDLPMMRAASEAQVKLWLGDGFAAMMASAEREGELGALTILNSARGMAEALPPDTLSTVLIERARIIRAWQVFMADFAVVVMPVSAELPFPDGLDVSGPEGLSRVMAAQLTQTSLPTLALPGLTVSTGLVGRIPVGVQIVASRYREDLCLLAGEAIEAGGVPPSPIDPIR